MYMCMVPCGDFIDVHVTNKGYLLLVYTSQDLLFIKLAACMLGRVSINIREAIVTQGYRNRRTFRGHL